MRYYFTRVFIFFIYAYYFSIRDCNTFDGNTFGGNMIPYSTLSVTDTISLIERLKLNLVKFRDNSEGDFEKVMKLSEEPMTKHDILKWDVSSS